MVIHVASTGRQRRRTAAVRDVAFTKRLRCGALTPVRSALADYDLHVMRNTLVAATPRGLFRPGRFLKCLTFFLPPLRCDRCRGRCAQCVGRTASPATPRHGHDAFRKYAPRPGVPRSVWRTNSSRPKAPRPVRWSRRRATLVRRTIAVIHRRGPRGGKTVGYSPRWHG